MKKPKIFLGIPVLETVKAHTFMSVLALLDYWRKHPLFELHYSIIIGSRQIHFARNSLVRAGMNSGMDYLIFIDADMTFPEDIVHQLYFASKDIVGVVYPGRISPHPANVFYWGEGKKRVEQVKPDWKIPEQEVIEVDAVGTGIMLIRRKVFEELSKPYFYYEDNRSEDIMFCEKARRNGFRIHVLTRPECGHIGDNMFNYTKR